MRTAKLFNGDTVKEGDMVSFVNSDGKKCTTTIEYDESRDRLYFWNIVFEITEYKNAKKERAIFQEEICQECNGDLFIPVGCCNGFECGCLGMPVDAKPCHVCNSDGKKSMPEHIAAYFGGGGPIIHR